MNAFLSANITSTLPLFAGSHDALFRIFRTIRQAAMGSASSIVSLVMGIACLIIVIKLIKLTYDMESDEQAAGFGGVTFRDSSGFDMLDIRESHLSFQSCTFQNNKWDEDWCHFISLDAASSARFSACVFDKATYYDLTGERFAESDILVESSKVVE